MDERGSEDTSQKPLQRAYQRDPEAIEAWQRERYPAIARQAKASGGDESGFRGDSLHGKTWGKKGQTPVVERPAQRQSVSAVSAVNARGGFWSAPTRRTERRSVCLAATTNKATSLARALGARRAPRAQTHSGEDLCYLHEGDADPAFSPWLRA
jgi:hypothetical protein